MNTNFDQVPQTELVRDVVHHNLEMMKKPMHDLDESMGGNAGLVVIDGKNCSCSAHNGYADKLTGKILIFTNDEPPQDIIDKSHHFILREALHFNPKSGTGAHKIVHFLGAEKFSSEARENIEEAIKQYNIKNWKL